MFLSVNGEIYNYLSIKEQLIAENPEFENEFVSDSDCEPVMYLYKKYGLGFQILLSWIIRHEFASTGGEG